MEDLWSLVLGELFSPFEVYLITHFCEIKSKKKEGIPFAFVINEIVMFI